MKTFHCRQGEAPLVVSIPHAGTHLPEELATGMTAVATAVADTDWHVDVLYDFLDALDATVIVATHSRYVIDLNRPPDGVPLYPGQTETGLCPLTTFDGESIYIDNEPDAMQIAHRREQFWHPYHDCLRKELDRLQARHGRVVLWDAHSIHSEVPAFFDGELPVLNIGTNSGRSCSNALSDALVAVAKQSRAFSSVLNGRFTGGYITRSYGHPDDGIHAVQLELAQRSYMDETPPFTFDANKAAEIRPVLRDLLTVAVEFSTNSNGG